MAGTKLDWLTEKQVGYQMKSWAYISLLLVASLHAQNRYDESFDPKTLNDWGDSKAVIESMRSLTQVYANMGTDLDSNLTQERPDFVYRVQLGSTQDYDAAIALESRANESFTEDVIIQFDSPYYKVRVGKMVNREDAQVLQSEALNRGYRRAWVVRTENSEDTEK